jgi:hypothetical protein
LIFGKDTIATLKLLFPSGPTSSNGSATGLGGVYIISLYGIDCYLMKKAASNADSGRVEELPMIMDQRGVLAGAAALRVASTPADMTEAAIAAPSDTSA